MVQGNLKIVFLGSTGSLQVVEKTLYQVHVWSHVSTETPVSISKRDVICIVVFSFGL